MNGAMVSARFAGHHADPFRLLKVAEIRQWQVQNRTALDELHSPFLDLPEWNLRACWKSTPMQSEYPDGAWHPPNMANVEFLQLDTMAPLPLVDVPELVYSEVMREVECFFLQYATTGNFECYYHERGDRQMTEYWRRVAFGPLTQQGQTRKQLLQRLLPHSKLASCCEIQDEFLRVRGPQHEYRIHLSSGKVQLGPQWKVMMVGSIPFTADHSGLPPGNGFPQLPFGGDIRLADILRTAGRLVRGFEVRARLEH
jgi:hypothetical protein